MTDRLPGVANSEPRGRFFVQTLGMICRRPVGWVKALLRRAHRLAPDARTEWWAPHRTRSRPVSLPTLRSCVVLAGLTLLPASPATAQGKLDARYQVTLSGIPVGKGAWVVDIADDQYSASASGVST